MVVLVTLATLPLIAEDAYQAQREYMVRHHIEARGITDREVLRVMRTTPRHEFVPEALWPRAYQDTPLPIGHRQTISQPYIVALMTESLNVDKSHRVLEIGTGSGYQAAVLAQLVEHVYTLEIVPELAKSVKKKLARWKNITARHGDGYQGWPEEAPFDRIILTAAPPELPAALIEQLKPGGLLLAPVGGTPWNQELVLVKKNLDGTVTERSLLSVVFVPMVKQ
jgi:protein-L-isoaspartate(D-aspartate) O-methyltransferase